MSICDVRVARVVVLVIVLGRPRRAMGRELVEQRAAASGRAGPGDRAVGQRLSEHDRVARSGSHLVQPWRPQICRATHVSELVRHLHVAGMAAGHTAEATTVAVRVLQLVGDHGEPIVETAVLIVKKLAATRAVVAAGAPTPTMQVVSLEKPVEVGMVLALAIQFQCASTATGKPSSGSGGGVRSHAGSSGGLAFTHLASVVHVDVIDSERGHWRARPPRPVAVVTDELLQDGADPWHVEQVTEGLPPLRITWAHQTRNMEAVLMFAPLTWSASPPMTPAVPPCSGRSDASTSSKMRLSSATSPAESVPGIVNTPRVSKR
jgi:hypothetical protein